MLFTVLARLSGLDQNGEAGLDSYLEMVSVRRTVPLTRPAGLDCPRQCMMPPSLAIIFCAHSCPLLLATLRITMFYCFLLTLVAVGPPRRRCVLALPNPSF
jgi:hypothetical protein